MPVAWDSGQRPSSLPHDTPANEGGSKEWGEHSPISGVERNVRLGDGMEVEVTGSGG